MILRHLGGVLLKKKFLLRVDEEIFDKVKDISEVEDRSINYMIINHISYTCSHFPPPYSIFYL